MAAQTEHRSGSLLQRIHGDRHLPWGSDPGQFSPEATAKTVARAGRFFGPGCYFGLEVEGIERIPPAPTMIVSNHSGGTTIPDVWGFGVAWYRHFGVSRPIHPMAHEIIVSNRVTGVYFARRGVLRGGRATALAVLNDFRRDLLVMPGGDLDTWRPYSKRYDVCFGGRTGYARLALQAGVPIVPVANAGAHETLIVLTTGQGIARALGLQAKFRANIFPIHLSLPWGLAVGPWPHLPTPVTLRYRIGAPITLDDRPAPGEEPTLAMVLELDRRVRAAVQGLLHELRASA